MKEAAGEANMTVITIVLIAIVLAIGTAVVTSMMNSSKNSSACSACGGIWSGGKCYAVGTDGKPDTSTKVKYDSCKNAS